MANYDFTDSLYPYNLYHAVTGHSGVLIGDAGTFLEDLAHKLLSERDFNLIMMRFRYHMDLSDIGKKIGRRRYEVRYRIDKMIKILALYAKRDPIIGGLDTVYRCYALNDLYRLPVDQLDLDPNLVRCLHRGKVHTIGELSAYRDFRRIPGIGRTKSAILVQAIQSAESIVNNNIKRAARVDCDL